MSDASTSPARAGYVLSIGMQKGGVSKTTNACHLAVALGEFGRRVLLWDVDENYGATKVFQIPPDAFFTTMSVLTGDSSAEEAILAFDDDDLDVELPRGVDFIPSSRALQGVDRALSSVDKFYNPNECLHPHVDALKALGRYDYILIDTGPQASPTTRSAYMVSDYFILSLVPEKLAVDSLPDALEDIANARRPGRNPNLHLLGLILSCMDRRVTLAKRYEEAITERFRQANQEPVKFENTIGRAAAIDRAAHQGQTILQAEPSHKVSDQYRKLAQEVEQRVLAHRALLGSDQSASRPAPAPLPDISAGVTANA
ncbi:MAG: ParA family protein [bacterium]|nr:ParA family protein [bacterium]